MITTRVAIALIGAAVGTGPLRAVGKRETAGFPASTSHHAKEWPERGHEFANRLGKEEKTGDKVGLSPKRKTSRCRRIGELIRASVVNEKLVLNKSVVVEATRKECNERALGRRIEKLHGGASLP